MFTLKKVAMRSCCIEWCIGQLHLTDRQTVIKLYSIIIVINDFNNSFLVVLTGFLSNVHNMHTMYCYNHTLDRN